MIEKLLDSKNQELENYKLKCYFNKNRKDQKKYKIFVMKHQENFQNVVLIKLFEIGISEKIASQVEIQSKQVLDQFNHDFKNPIQASLFITDKLYNQFLKNIPGQHNDYKALKYNIQLVINMFDIFLDYSKYKKGILSICMNKFDLNKQLISITKQFKEYANMRNVTFNCKEIVKEIICFNDLRRLQLVLFNFLQNALKFSRQKGQIYLHVEEFSNNNLIYFSIKDNGVGMSSKQIAKIINPFQQIEQQTINNDRSGIGLYTALQIIKKIGPLDNIFVNSKIDQGTEFAFLMYVNVEIQEVIPEIKEFRDNQEKLLSFLRKSLFDNDLINSSEDSISNIQMSQYNGYSHDYYSFNNEQNFQINKVNNIFTKNYCSFDEIKSNSMQIKKKNFSLSFSHHQEYISQDEIQTINAYNTINQSQQIKLITQSSSMIDYSFKFQNNFLEDDKYKVKQCKYLPKILKILIVEDNDQLREQIIFQFNRLKDNRILIVESNDGITGLEQFKQANHPQNDQPFNLIFSDINMPIMNGYMMIENINSLCQNYQYQKSDIIAVSSDESDDHNQMCKKLGIIHVCAKPLLKNIIKNILDQYDTQYTKKSREQYDCSNQI